MLNYTVIKKDKSEEKFDPNKIFDIIVAAGASESVAKLVVKNIVRKLFKIKSSKLRRHIYHYLKKIDKDAASNYKKHYIQEKY